MITPDADDAQSWERLGYLARVLADEDAPSYLERSRRGGHLWLFLAQAVAGREARAFGKGLLVAHQIEGVELYPKQDQLADGLGSLIRTPFGVHWLAGRRHGFYTADGAGLAGSMREQICALGAPKTVPEAATLSEWIKASLTVLEFVGLCPFHDDHHPSFGVNAAPC